jgi:hypothetical protein
MIKENGVQLLNIGRSKSKKRLIQVKNIQFSDNYKGPSNYRSVSPLDEGVIQFKNVNKQYKIGAESTNKVISKE